MLVEDDPTHHVTHRPTITSSHESACAMRLALEMAAAQVGGDLASTEGLWEGSGREWEGSGRGVAGSFLEWQGSGRVWQGVVGSGMAVLLFSFSYIYVGLACPVVGQLQSFEFYHRVICSGGKGRSRGGDIPESIMECWISVVGQRSQQTPGRCVYVHLMQVAATVEVFFSYHK